MSKHLCFLCGNATNCDLEPSIQNQNIQICHSCENSASAANISQCSQSGSGTDPQLQGGENMCPICQKGFKFYSYLIRHLKTHSYNKTHVCAGCGKAYKHPFDLTRHTKKCKEMMD